MSGYHERLQGKVRLARIQRIRTISLLALLLVTVFFVASGLAAEGASLKPLYLPVADALLLALIMGLVATILAMYFRNLEIRHAPGDSQRFLMAKYSMSRAAWVAGIAIALAVLLFLPMAGPVAGGLLTEAPTALSIPGFSGRWVNFTSPDALGLSYVDRIVVLGASGSTGSVRVTVAFANRTEDAGWVNGTERLEIALDDTARTVFGLWSIRLDNVAGGGAVVTVLLRKALVPALFAFVPFLLALYGVANVGWWVGLRPIRERTRGAAVYGGGTSLQPGQDERFFSEYARDPWREAIPPPPPPEPSRASPAASPNVARPAAVAAPATPAPAEPARPAEPTKARKPAKPKPDTPETFITKGDVLAAAGQPDSALVAYEEALRLHPTIRPALLGRARALEALGKTADAVDAYRKVLAVEPRDEEALRSIGGILIAERRWREALEVVDESLRHRPNDPKALERRGDILTNLGRRPEALTAYHAALALNPADDNLKQKVEEVRVDVPGLLSRALIASASGNYGQALVLFDEILEVEPGNVNALIGKAVAYRRSGKSMESLNCLDLVLSIQPGNAAALYNRGQILEAEGDLDGALETYDRLVSVSSLDDEAWAAQGDVLVRMGREEDALRAYAEALKLNPGDEVIRAKVRELQEARAFHAEVLDELYRVKGIGPAKAKALLQAGFQTAEDFARADLDDLLAVKGITRKIAQDLRDHFRKQAVPAK